jgi:hypothetical protein
MENYKCDRKDWVRGEWDNEPDRVDFIHAGFACFIQRNMSGAWCGYVGVPNTHPAYGVSYSNYDHPVSNLDVHGGLTYSAPCSGHLCHVPEPGMPDDVWWFGFDTAHHMDIVPLRMLWEVFKDHGTYKNQAYVTSEVIHLAEQLAGMVID